MKKLHNISVCVFSVFLLLMCTITAFAENTSFDINKKGSLSLTLRDVEGNAALSGAEISIYHIASVPKADYTVHYELTEEFAKSGVKIGEFENEELASDLMNYISENKISPITAFTNEDGNAFFENLSLGIYFVTQSGSVAGYSDFKPYFVSVPIKENGVWIYDINAVPKTGAVRLIDIDVKKVWNDDGKNRPSAIQVQLEKNGQAVELAELNEQNGWRCEWKQLPYDENWNVTEINIPQGYTAKYTRTGNSITITNSSALANTGQLDWPIPILFCAGLLLIIVGFLLCFLRQRKNSNE